MPARLIGIGVGPGDSGLVTVKASQLLQELDVILVPKAQAHKESLAYTIASPYIPPETPVLERVFPMVHDEAEKVRQWEKIAQEISQYLISQQTVGFLTLGDPNTYSTFTYIADRVGLEHCQTIPGISSYSAVASALKTPLAIDRESFCVVSATDSPDKLKLALEHFDSIVVVKVHRHWSKVRALLEDMGLLACSQLVAHASLPDQEIISDLSLLDEGTSLPYFSTLLVTKRQSLM